MAANARVKRLMCLTPHTMRLVPCAWRAVHLVLDIQATGKATQTRATPPPSHHPHAQRHTRYWLRPYA